VLRRVRQKVVHLLLVLFVVSLLLTFLIDLTPGDPAYSILGEQATPEQIDQLTQELNLDGSFASRYGTWVGDILSGELGTSYVSKQSVWSSIANALPVTVELVLVAIGLSLLIAVPLGVFTAHRPGGIVDRAWTVISSALLSVPVFVQALILVFLFSLKNDWLPPTGWTYLTENPIENLRHLALPALSLALIEVPAYSRLLRSDMIATLQEDFILNAKAKGQPPRRILFVHALRPASVSTITLAGLSVARLMGGALVIESLFALPGIGLLLLNSVNTRDIPSVQGIVMFIALVYVVANMLVDVGHRVIDPRMRDASLA